MEAYWTAKEALFQWPGLQSAVMNIDDPQGARLAAKLVAQGLDVWTCSRQGPARLQARQIDNSEGIAFEVIEGSQVRSLRTALIGDYNIDNLLGVMGCLRALGISLDEAVQSCTFLTPVPGRMQRVAKLKTDVPLTVVDYAHTPDAIEKALVALRSMAQQRGGRLWCLLGCGGDRDPGKRPLMAAAAQAHADGVFLTSDNPRSESPQSILDDMRKGLKHFDNVTIESDRVLAIHAVIDGAQDQDVVLVAGKGHETYQEIMGVRHPFSDAEIVQSALQRRAARLTAAEQRVKA
jgi:UDP-N-acetylmuramoyl-L-alanyl-D-glutamate--2,6-diaminopimelate ligase